MTIDFKTKTKYQIRYTTEFKRNYKKIKKQGKDIEKLKHIINKLANGMKLEEKYNDHALYNDKRFKHCRDCHIEPDWVLIYKYEEDEIILLLIYTGSHSEILDK